MNRRGFLKTVGGGIAAAAVAPYVITKAGILMPVRRVVSAERVMFTPSGMGYSQRTIQDALREWVDVRDYGAIGDGIADDTGAFRMALLAAKRVYAGPASYRLSEPLTVPAGKEFHMQSAFVSFDRGVDTAMRVEKDAKAIVISNVFLHSE